MDVSLSLASNLVTSNLINNGLGCAALMDVSLSDLMSLVTISFQACLRSDQRLQKLYHRVQIAHVCT